MGYTLSILKKFTILCTAFFFLIGCQSLEARENSIVAFLQGAELQIETADQRQELKRAFEDMLRLSPAQLKKQRYANYRMEAGKWTLPKILSAYFLPNKPMLIDEGHFYTDVNTESTRSVIKDKLKLLN